MRVDDIPIGGSAGNLLGNPLCTNMRIRCVQILRGDAGEGVGSFSCILLQERV